MALTISLLNDNGNIYLVDGRTGNPLGTVAEARIKIKDAMDNIERRDIIRAIAKRFIASGLDPLTATVAQIKTAIEASGVDA